MQPTHRLSFDRPRSLSEAPRRTSFLPFLSLLLATTLLATGCAREAADGALSVEGDSGFETDANLDATCPLGSLADAALTVRRRATAS